MNLHMNMQHICLNAGSKLLLSSPLGSTAIHTQSKVWFKSASDITVASCMLNQVTHKEPSLWKPSHQKGVFKQQSWWAGERVAGGQYFTALRGWKYLNLCVHSQIGSPSAWFPNFCLLRLACSCFSRPPSGFWFLSLLLYPKSVGSKPTLNFPKGNNLRKASSM